MLIGDILDHNAKVYPKSEAVVSGDEKLTFKELRERVLRVSTLFLKLGLRKGEPVAVLSRNSPRYVELLFGLTGIGAAVCPLNVLLIPAELIRIINDLGARVLLFSKEYEDSIGAIGAGCPLLTQCICIDHEIEGHPSLPSFFGEGPSAPSGSDLLHGDDIAMITYAGREGKHPVGTVLTHRNIMTASYFSALEMNISRDDVYLSTAPLPFLAGTGRMLKFMLVGAKVVIMDYFEPERALHLMEEHGVTQLLLVPQMMARMAKEAVRRDFDFSTLRKVTYSTVVPVEHSVLEDSMSVFPGDFVQSFALVEASGVISYLHIRKELVEEEGTFSRRLSSIGQEMMGLSLKVVDSDGIERGPDMVGELVVTGPTVMKRYHRNPLLTEEALKDGWLHTGFAASIDDEGYIYVVDRLREVIVRGGINIDPEEVEEIISEHEGVEEVAVVAKPDSVWGEVPIAMVVLKQGFEEEVGRVLQFAKENMAPFKIPEAIEPVGALPRNSQGKILKARIKEEMKGKNGV